MILLPHHRSATDFTDGVQQPLHEVLKNNHNVLIPSASPGERNSWQWSHTVQGSLDYLSHLLLTMWMLTLSPPFSRANIFSSFHRWVDQGPEIVGCAQDHKLKFMCDGQQSKSCLGIWLTPCGYSQLGVKESSHSEYPVLIRVRVALAVPWAGVLPFSLIPHRKNV